jgi:O-antigen/teichoic acid export membrane protein
VPRGSPDQIDAKAAAAEKAARAAAREARSRAFADADLTAEVVGESIGSSGSRAGGLVRGGVFLTLAVLSANLLNAVFQFVMARILEPDEFSLLASMFAVIVMVTVPLSGLQTVMARAVAARVVIGGLPAAGAALRKAARQMGRTIIAVVVVLLVSAYPLIEIFHIDRPLPFIATAVALAAALPLPIAFGALQGTERFGLLSFVQPIYALLKLLAGIVIGMLGFGASAVLFGVAGATAASIIVAIAPLRMMLRASEKVGPDPTMTLVSAYTVGTAIGVCGYAIHTNVDVLVSRISFGADTAGQWAAAAVVAKTILLIPSGITTVLFPRVAKLKDRGRERQHMLAGLATVLVVGLVVATIYWRFSVPIINIAFGSDYERASKYLGALSYTMVLYALVQIYLFHFLSLGGIRYALTVAALVLVQIGLFLVLHSTPADLIIVQAIAAALLVIAGELFYRGRRERVVAGFDPSATQDPVREDAPRSS